MNEIGKLTLKYSPLSQLLVFINEIFGYLNFLFILVNKRKRAITDYLAGTYVIKKES
jgi:uncharacterized RDD family membrane protein YckC